MGEMMVAQPQVVGRINRAVDPEGEQMGGDAGVSERTIFWVQLS